ncbi:MAG: hypothetical protein PHV63_00445 [Candidatus Daviesbacteria bacterium]|nr:hypothetical protein [Candidatus Daviesbacteria bacterium]
MAIQLSKKQSDLEKRLQLLRRQVYGGNNQSSSPSATHSYQLSQLDRTDGSASRGEQLRVNNYSTATDITYLHQDLLKILLFASCTIGAEVILFLLVKNNVLTLNFF